LGDGIARRIAAASDLLRRSGAGNPRFEAELLAAAALARERIFLFTHPEYEPTEEETARFDMLLARRLCREPLQYVLGTAAFRDLLLGVGPGVAIPRCETELLVEIAWQALMRWRARAAGTASRGASARPWLIDVGVGSGAILLALLHEAVRSGGETPWFRPLGIDIAPRPLAVTAENARRCRLPVPALLRGDLLSAVDPAAPVAAIVSNPPYVSSAEMRALPEEIREHEPPIALHGGDDGLEVIRRLLDLSAPFLHRGALFCCEIGAAQEGGVREELARRGWLRYSTIHPDLAGRPRVVLVEPCAG